MPAAPPPTIAVFDSGFGGLTVLRALLPLFPGTHFVYLGDTARLPYGEKSRETIVRYALTSAAFLLAQGAQMLVVACNTASALALPELQASLPIPVLGVISPGTQAAAAQIATNPDHQEVGAPSLASEMWVRSPSNSPQVLVLATSATVHSHAYAQSLRTLGVEAHEKACPLLVPLVEEGWTGSDPATAAVTAEVLRIYLAEALAEAPQASVLVLGCTHYPLLKPMIEQVLDTLSHPMHIVDSAHATALAASALFPPQHATGTTTCSFYATDSIEKFERLGSAFLGQPVRHVQLVDLGG